MERLKKFGTWFVANIGNLGSAVAYLLSIGFFPALLRLTHEATPIGYGIAAATGLLMFIAGRALWMAARSWRASARIKERLSSDSSPFDPMEPVYRNKRLFLRDLAPLGRNFVQGKHFIDCEIIGPGNAILGLRSSENIAFPDIRENTFHDVNIVQIAPIDPVTNKPVIFNSVQLIDCHFIRCNFFTLNLLFFHRFSENWNWITPYVIQTPLLEDASDAQK